MPRPTKRKAQLNKIYQKGGIAFKKKTEAWKRCCILYAEIIATILRDNDKVQKQLNLYLRKENKCGWKVEQIPSGFRNPFIKRLAPSLMYKISNGLWHEKVVSPNSSRESVVKKEWVECYASKENFLDEVWACFPDYPFIAAIMDGIIYYKGKYVIVEFKGFLKYHPKIKDGDFPSQDPIIQQIVTYSERNLWKNVLLVYGMGKLIYSVYFDNWKFNQFKKWFFNAKKDYFLNYFSENVFIWGLLKVTKSELSKKQKEELKKNIPEIKNAVLYFYQKCQTNHRNGKIIYPKLEEFPQDPRKIKKIIRL